MPKFKKEFDIRRVLFGLTAIIRSPLEQLPPLIAQKQPDLFKEICTLATRIFKERKDTLKENEDFLAKGLEHEDEADYDDEEEEDEKDIDEAKDKLGQFDADVDDDDDSDYEIEGDDNGLYDSNLDDVDELLFLKETVDTIHQSNPQFFSHLSGMTTPDDLNKFAEALNNAQELKAREEKCTKDIDEAEKKKA